MTDKLTRLTARKYANSTSEDGVVFMSIRFLMPIDFISCFAYYYMQYDNARIVMEFSLGHAV